MKDVEEILHRLYQKLGIKKDIEFGKKFEIKTNTISGWKKRNSIPYEIIIEIANQENISLDYIFFNKEVFTEEEKEEADIAINALPFIMEELKELREDITKLKNEK